MNISHTPSSFYSFPDRVITPLRRAGNKKLRILMRFNEQSRYKRPEAEKDILKATGVSFGPIRDARQNSVMVGYRYIEELDYWEAGPYYHDTTGKAYNPDFVEYLQMIRVRLGETVITDINWENPKPVFTIQAYDFNRGKQVVQPITFRCTGVEATTQNRLISSYAGGSSRIQTPFSYTREIETK